MTDLHRIEGAVNFEVLSLGAALHRLEIPGPDGSWRNLLLTREDVDSVDPSRSGATLGRVAGRIGNAHFELDGEGYDLDPNEPPHHLHGGKSGFDSREWEVLARSASGIALRLTSPDGDQGYPGQLTATVTYSLLDSGVQVQYRAITDAPTVVTLTGHPYFNLGGPLAQHRMTIPARSYCPTRIDHIATGEISPVAGTALDCQDGRIIGDVLDEAALEGITRQGGLNHDFVVDGSGLRDHIRLEGPTGTVLTVRSDAPTLHLYSAEHIDRAGLAIEPQAYQDAPNHTNFEPITLRPGEVYEGTVQWIVEW